MNVGNTYAGQTFVEAGRLQIQNDAALSTFGSTATSTTVFNGAMLELFGPRVMNETLFLNGNGLTDSVGRPLGALHLVNDGTPGADTATWQGPITLLSNTSIGAQSSVDAGIQVFAKLVITGGITGAFGLTKVDAGNLRLPN